MKLNLLYFIVFCSFLNVIVTKLKDKMKQKMKVRKMKTKGYMSPVIIMPVPMGYGSGLPVYGGPGVGGYGGYGGYGGGLALGGFGGGIY